MKKIEHPISRQQFYSKCKDSFVKKSNELAVLCETDVALLMFSPDGQVTSYSNKESFEDTMLQIMNQPGELNWRMPSILQHLMQSLTQSKKEGEMVKKIAITEAHKEKLNKLNQTLSEAQQNIRYYKPQVENISSVQEADASEQFLRSAIKQIQRSKAKLLGGERFLQSNENVAVASVNTEDTAAAGNGSAHSN
ncbi:agamous-like MADS-box protein AGL66 [Solanum dulcamara]|uniref:agamous-like MADS-box protein AGL66 n=1 Tax=Solanum dulcamara TaxID=45834 RepID=UPI0024860F38|nr:agamous-like MADS-box protein AGL66 [Solanum dulcamara]